MCGDRKGELLLLTGPMFAGKSSSLIAFLQDQAAIARSPGADEPGLPECGPLAFKPAFDTRDGDTTIRSRDRSRMAALPISSWPTQVARHAALAIDEVQFLVPPHYRGDIVDDIRAAVAGGALVAAAGLDTDYLRRPFEVVARLIAIADRHLALRARCHVCDAPAAWTAKMIETGQRLELDDGLYEARCDLHWSPPGTAPADGSPPPASVLIG